MSALPTEIQELIKEYHGHFRIRGSNLTVLMQDPDEKRPERAASSSMIENETPGERLLSFTVSPGLWMAEFSPLVITTEGSLINTLILSHSTFDRNTLPPLTLSKNKIREIQTRGKMTDAIKLCYDAPNGLSINLLNENDAGLRNTYVSSDVYGVGAPLRVIVFICKYRSLKSNIIEFAISKAVAHSGSTEDGLRKVFPEHKVSKHIDPRGGYLSYKVHGFKVKEIAQLFPRHEVSDRTYNLIFDNNMTFWYLSAARKQKNENSHTITDIDTDKLAPQLSADMRAAVRDVNKPLSNPVLLALFKRIYDDLQGLNVEDHIIKITDLVRGEFSITARKKTR